MYLSGSVGYTLLEKNEKYILLLADIHDGVKYCKQDSVMISSYLNKLSKDNNIMLEEITTNEYDLKDLWPNSQHTKELKQLNQTNEKIIPIDIRPMLLPFSWELVESNKKIGDMKLIIYLNMIDEFFNKSSNLYKSYILPKLNILTQINNKIILIHFNELLSLYKKLKTDYIKDMNYTIIYIYHNNINILFHINNLCSMIMEWYSILLIQSSISNSIIHIGLAHSNKILDLLTQIYNFKIITSNGLNKMRDIYTSNENIQSSCILLPYDITKRYKFN